MNKRLMTRAIGASDGKTLVLQNDCARVGIQCELADNGKRQYHVAGDCEEQVFADPVKALEHALRSLAVYMDGSPNR